MLTQGISKIIICSYFEAHHINGLTPYSFYDTANLSPLSFSRDIFLSGRKRYFPSSSKAQVDNLCFSVNLLSKGCFNLMGNYDHLL